MGDSCHWSHLHDTLGTCIRPGGTMLTERALKICSLPDSALVADVGCGGGETLQYLEQRGYSNLVGIDTSAPLLVQAATHLATARLLQASAETLPCSSGSFDLLLCECVLSLLPNKGPALDEFARVVKKGGFLVLSDLCTKKGGSISGLLTREAILEQLMARGFTPLMWEEHTQLLKEFVVRMIFAGQPWQCRQPQWTEGNRGIPDSYFLLVCRKGDETEGTA